MHIPEDGLALLSAVSALINLIRFCRFVLRYIRKRNRKAAKAKLANEPKGSFTKIPEPAFCRFNSCQMKRGKRFLWHLFLPVNNIVPHCRILQYYLPLNTHRDMNIPA